VADREDLELERQGGWLNMARHTRAQSRILQGMRLMDEAAVADYADNPDEQVRAARQFLHGWNSIMIGVKVITHGRKSSDRQLSDALRSLVASGEVIKSGDGAYTTPLYILAQAGEEKS
jgi:hypothetical protein